MGKNGNYIPALSFDLLTPLYDPLVRWLMPESRFKTRLVRHARIQSGQRVLDLGCGTATLTILIKQSHPDAEVIGIDGDAKILNIARRKATKVGADVTLHEGMAFELPYADDSFDRVLTSMVLHHLTPDDKRRTLAEVFRVLEPRGELHVADFRRQNKSLPDLFREVGFDGVEEYDNYRTVFGTLTLWRAQRDKSGALG